MKQVPIAFMRPETVIERFAWHTGTPLEDVCGPSQTREITRRRHELMWLLRTLTTSSLTQIGELLGGKDPKTVDHGIDRVTIRAAEEPGYRQLLADLRAAIATPAVAPVLFPDMRLTMAQAVLADPTLSDCDARTAARVILGSTTT